MIHSRPFQKDFITLLLADDQVVPWNAWNELKIWEIIGGGGWTRTNDLRMMRSCQTPPVPTGWVLALPDVAGVAAHNAIAPRLFQHSFTI